MEKITKCRDRKSLIFQKRNLFDSSDNNENKPVKNHKNDSLANQRFAKINPFFSFIIFLERIFEIISPAIEFLGRGLISLFFMSWGHPALIVNIVLILWTFKPIIEVLEI
jgi:hypothetical protein